MSLRLKFGGAAAAEAAGSVNGHAESDLGAIVSKKELRAKQEFAGVCPDCGETLFHEGGCAVCKSCSYSRCG
jgi:ribonucleoside-diphosphate reductase alpha chain